MDLMNGIGDAFVGLLLDKVFRPWLKAYTQKFVRPGGITQAEADEAVRGDMVDLKIAMLQFVSQEPVKP